MRKIVIFMTLTALLSACGSADRSRPQPEPAAAPVTSVTPAPIAAPTPQNAVEQLPLAGYLATDEQRHLVANAFFILVNRCMTAAGFPARLATSARTESVPQSWRYGLNDLEVATKYGYHTPPKYQVASAPGITSDSERPLSAEEEYAYTGGDTQGCVGQAERQLGKGDNLNYMDDQLAQSLSVASFDQSHRDSRVVEVISRWRTCMRTAGFPAPDPLEPINVAKTPKSSTKEIATAKADVLCKQQTNLFAEWHAVETAYQKAMIEANFDELEKGRRSVATAVQVASTI